MLIRLAKPDDALIVARIHVRSWQAAYQGLIPDDYLKGLRPEERARRYEFASENPLAAATLVAMENDTLVGFATVAPARDADAAGHGELCALYVDPDRLRRGVGSALLTAACERLVARGFRNLVLWVLAGNIPAQQFYEQKGWRKDGRARKATLWEVAVDEIRYRLVIA